MGDKELMDIAKKVRIDIIEMLSESKSGHPGGSLSCADILTVLYFDKMCVDIYEQKNDDRDRLVLSKGHAAPALYAVLAERGFFDIKELKTLRKYGSILQGERRGRGRFRVSARFGACHAVDSSARRACGAGSNCREFLRASDP